MNSRDRNDERDMYYTAAGALDTAYRELGDAADCLRGLGASAALRAIGEAREAIDRAKGEIGA